MANLERGGIELIVKGFQNFMSSIGQVNKSYSTMNKAADNAAKSVTNSGNKVAAAMNRVVIANNNARKAEISHEGAVRRLASAQEAYSDSTLENVISNTERLRKAEASEEQTALSLANAKIRQQVAGDALTAAQEQQNSATLVGIGASTQMATVMKVLGVAVAAVGIALGVAAAAWGVFKKGIDLVMGVVNKFISLIKQAASAIANLLGRALSVALGLGIYDMFRKAGDAIRGLMDETLGAVSYFQKLNIQLEALTARDISNEFGIPTSKAFLMIGNRVKELTDWITLLAVKTPFTAAKIAETLAMANAMGLNIGMAKEMTKATINFTSAMGLSEEHMFRIIYNFGQMLAQGKLNGREFRDLANSFVPVWEIMRRMGEQAGMTAQEMKDLAFKGGVPVEAFFKEFITMVEEDFSGAATKMARTLEGVANNMRDFMQIILGTKVLGPLMGEVAARMARMLDRLLSPDVRKAADNFGQALLKAFNVLSPAVDDLTASLGNLARAFGLVAPTAGSFIRGIGFITTGLRRLIEFITGFINQLASNLNVNLAGVAKSAATWGYNIVAMLAKGMAMAVNLIAGVISVISRMLSFFFKPGSPPRIAPNIDKWGADTMTEYMKGWLNFDLSVFGDISSKIESFLRSIPGGIGKENIGLVPAILGSRQAVAETINLVRDGLISVGEAADKIIKRTGRLTAEFRAYITALFEVERAQKLVEDAANAVAAAEERVAQAQAVVDEIGKKIKVTQEEQAAITEKYTGILKELNDQLQKVTTEYDEQRRIQEINQAIGTGLLTAAEKERLEMEKKALLLKQQIRNTEDERDTAVDAVQQRIDAFEAEQKAAQMIVDASEAQVEAAKAAEKAAQTQVDAAKDQLDAAEALIDIQIDQNNLIQEQIDLLEKLAKAAAAAAGGAGGAAAVDWEDIFDISGLGEVSTSIERSASFIRKNWEKEPTFDQLFRQGQAAMDKLIASFGNLEPALAPLTGAGGAFSNLSSAISGLWKVIGPNKEGEMERVFRFEHDQVTAYEKMGMALGTIADAILKFPKTEVGNIFVKIAEGLSKIDWVGLGTGIANLILSFEALIILISEKGPLAGTLAFIGILFRIVLEQMALDFKTQLLAITNTVLGWISDVIFLFTGLRLDLVGESIIPDMMQDIYDVITTRLQDVLTWLENTWIVQTIKAITQWATDVIGENGILTKAAKDIYDKITTKVGELQTWWETTWSGIKTYVLGIFNDPDGIVAKVEAALNALADFFAPAGNLASKISSFITNTLDALGDALQGIIDKLKTAIGLQGDLKSGANPAVVKDKDTNVPLEGRGGPVYAGRSVITGDRGRELFTPLVNGYIFPNWLTERMMAPAMATTQNITYVTNIEMNPSYRNVQSEASVYYDITAALSAARM